MPLPPNSTISLQGHSRPGEGITTIPKIAMVIRMTEETLDALQNISGADRMDFEFGDKSGIFVRDQFFPMRYDKEKDNQELFIRTTTATRPNPPLKLNANVVGKFAVEQILSDKITQRVHNATAAAAKQKAERKTIMLDTPPPVKQTVPQKSAPKKKGPSKSTGKSTPTIVKSYAVPVSQQTPSSSSAVSLSKELATTYRQRLVHYLALGAATVQDIFKEFDGSGVDHTIRSGIMDLLIEVAEQEQVPRKTTTSSQAVKWQLKLQTWLEVRPYQYSGYTDNVRTKVARTARTRLVSLKIPESDPAWGHVKFRASGQPAINSNSATVQRSINGVKSATAASARPASGPTSIPFKANTRLDPATTPVRSTKGKERETDTEKEEGELSASQTPPRVPASMDRRLPSSRPSGASTPLMQPPQAPVSPRPPSSSQTPSVPPKRTGPIDARVPRRIPPEPSERARPAPPIPPPAPGERKSIVQPKREAVQTKKVRTSRPGSEIGAPPPANSLQPVKGRGLARRERDGESDVDSLRKARRETDRESDRESTRGRHKDREHKARNIGKEREGERGQPRDKIREREQSSSRPVKSAMKRKPSESSGEESSDWGYEERKNIRKSILPSANSSTIKVKTEREIVPVRASVSSRKTFTRDSPPPKQKIKLEPSPTPLSKTKPVQDRKVIASSSSTVPKTSNKEVKADGGLRSTNGKSLKRQRQSIEFTSSSDEEKEPVPKSSKVTTKAMASSHPLPAKNSSTAVSAGSEPGPRPSKHLIPQSKHEQMRSRYSIIYSEYIVVFQKLVAQKHKFDAILRYGSVSPSEQSDSESDMEDLEELEELRKRYQRLHDELEEIKRVYMAYDKTLVAVDGIRWRWRYSESEPWNPPAVSIVQAMRTSAASAYHMYCTWQQWTQLINGQSHLKYTRRLEKRDRKRFKDGLHAQIGTVDGRIEFQSRKKTPMPTLMMRLDLSPRRLILTLHLLLYILIVGVVSPDDDARCSLQKHVLRTHLTTTSSHLTEHSAQTPPAPVQSGVQASRPILLMGFALGSLAVIYGFRPLEPLSFSRFSALFELRSLLLSVVVFFALLVLAYLTNPSETSFRAFLTEQAFRHHLSRLDDGDAQDDWESASSAAQPSALLRRGLSIPYKNRSANAYSSPPFAFASRASVSLRTPKHIFRSLGILSIAAVVPASSPKCLSSARTQRDDETATVTNGIDGKSMSDPSISDSWFIGIFGMWFWAANLDSFWRDTTRDEADGTSTGVLEIKALDRSDEPTRAAHSDSNPGQRSNPKPRPRDRFGNQNGNALDHRTQSPPPLPKSVSLPLHAKRGFNAMSLEKSSSTSFQHLTSRNSFAISSAPSVVGQPATVMTPEFRSISANSLPGVTPSASPSSSPSRSPSALFASSPLIAELLRQLSSSRNAISDLRAQLQDFDSSSTETRTALEVELEGQRERKRAEDLVKADLKAQTRALEDQKRTVEAARRDAEKRLKAARSEKDSADTRIDRFERAISKSHYQMESNGAAIVASGVETGALVENLEEQIETKRSEVRIAEEDVAQLALHIREMEEKVADEKRRLETAVEEAKKRREEFVHRQIEAQGRSQVIAFSIEDKLGAMRGPQQLQSRWPDNRPDLVDAFSSSSLKSSMPDSSHTSHSEEGQVQRLPRTAQSIPTPLDAKLANGFSTYNQELQPRQTARSCLVHEFSPFSSDLTSPGPLSPTGESLIPSSLYEPLGMTISNAIPDPLISASDMGTSRSFQSEDDIILDRKWSGHRDASQQSVFPVSIIGTDASPVSPAGSSHSFDPFETNHPIRERSGSLDTETRYNTLTTRLPGVDFTHRNLSANNVPIALSDNVDPVLGAAPRRSGWFTSHKDRTAKSQDRKGLNPDAKEFSLSKEKERSLSTFLSHSRGSGHGSSSGTSSTPSTASLPTPESSSLTNSPSLSTPGVKTPSTQTQITPPARTAGSWLALGSSWFGPSHAFTPTPLEREQLSRVLGGTANSSFDKLDRLHSLPASPQPRPAIVRNPGVAGLPPRPWDGNGAFGLGANGLKSSSGFSPFDDELVHSSQADECTDGVKRGTAGTVADA